MLDGKRRGPITEMLARFLIGPTKLWSPQPSMGDASTGDTRGRKLQNEGPITILQEREEKDEKSLAWVRGHDSRIQSRA